MDGNYSLFTRVMPYKGTRVEINYGITYFIKFSPEGDTIHTKRVSFDHFLSDYVELPDSYYAVTTDVRTMGGPTTNFLNKYDRNWKMLWSKRIDKPKFPYGNTFLRLTDTNELLLVSDEGKEVKGKSVNQVISIEKYDLKGNSILEKSYFKEMFNDPASIIKAYDNNYLLAAETGAGLSRNLWLMKINQHADTIWTKVYKDFDLVRLEQLKDSSLILYGMGYYLGTSGYSNFLKIMKTDKEGNLLWQKSIKQSYDEYAGNIIETSDGNYLFSSSIEPIVNQGRKANIFELDKNGNKIFEKTFDYLTEINAPILIKGGNKIIMYSEKKNKESDDPTSNVILVTKTTE